MFIVSIDSSTRGCSVALHGESGLLASYDLYTDRSSSSMLTTLLKNAVEHADLNFADLNAIAVAKGPGSYTGLRVGVSTAKGLCFALDKPLIAINTLEAMFLQVKPFFPDTTLFCPMIDARRMEVYASVFDYQGEIVLPTTAIILDSHAFSDLLAKHTIVFFGDGAAKSKSILLNQPNAIFIDQEIRPSARTVGELAVAAFEKGQFEELATFEPYYLKDFMTPPTRKVAPIA